MQDIQHHTLCIFAIDSWIFLPLVVSFSVSNDGKNFDFFRDYYLNEQWKKELTQPAIEYIKQNIDISLLAKFGYKQL